MSIFGSIVSKILGHHGAPTPTGTAPTGAAPTGTAGGVASTAGAPTGSIASDATRTPPVVASPPPAVPPASAPPVTSLPSDAGPVTTGSAPVPGAPSLANVDVAAILTGMAASHGETLDWRHSIVDMMKLLGLDSSLASREALAKELNYAGDTHDSAAMNIWLHKQVMVKLAENGGKVPDDLRV